MQSLPGRMDGASLVLVRREIEYASLATLMSNFTFTSSMILTLVFSLSLFSPSNVEDYGWTHVLVQQCYPVSLSFSHAFALDLLSLLTLFFLFAAVQQGCVCVCECVYNFTCVYDNHSNHCSQGSKPILTFIPFPNYNFFSSSPFV